MGTWIGTSGWSYDHWQDVLYHGCSPAERLGRYAAEFDTVELNASFYRWPGDAAFTSWQRRLPDGFRMSVKAPRALTHARQLYASEFWVGRITAGCVAADTPPVASKSRRTFVGLIVPCPPWYRHPRGRTRSWADQASPTTDVAPRLICVWHFSRSTSSGSTRRIRWPLR